MVKYNNLKCLVFWRAMLRMTTSTVVAATERNSEPRKEPVQSNKPQKVVVYEILLSLTFYMIFYILLVLEVCYFIAWCAGIRICRWIRIPADRRLVSILQAIHLWILYLSFNVYPSSCSKNDYNLSSQLIILHCFKCKKHVGVSSF